MNHKSASLPSLLAAAIGALAATQPALAAGFDQFTPIAGTVVAGSLPESAPFLLASPAFGQSTVAANDLGPRNGGVKRGDNWDMITHNETGADAGRYLFTPYETGRAGVMRVDLHTGHTDALVDSAYAGQYVSFDASKWTPWGTYLTAEESWGSGSSYGRLFEITNPLAAPGEISMLQRGILPRVSHEGLEFDSAGNLYFVDEFNGGSLYKFSSQNPFSANFFDAGQTFVLQVGDGLLDSATGAASWVAITDALGHALPGIATVNTANGFAVDGRAAADQVKGTNFMRPEDLQLRREADGSETLFMATTTTDSVYAIKLGSGGATAEVKLFATPNTLNEATGLAAGNLFNNADNLAMDANGNIYIVEDQPGGDADIWFARDADRDGVAESIARWATMSTVGAEPTGLYFSPFDPSVAYVNVQHAASDVDRMMKLTAPSEVPVPAAAWLFASALAPLAMRMRRKA